MTICLTWASINVVFEFGQTELIGTWLVANMQVLFANVWRYDHLESYFYNGTFDLFDILSTVFVAVTAYHLILKTQSGGRMTAVAFRSLLLVPVVIVGLFSITASGNNNGNNGNSNDPTYSVGGTVSGLEGTLALQNNGSDDLTITEDGTFTFATVIAHASPYSIPVLTQPSGQTCSVTNVTGKVSRADVTNVVVTCFDASGLDSACDSDDIVVHDNAAGGSGRDIGNSITIDANGKILVTGDSENNSGNYDMVIWRYNP